MPLSDRSGLNYRGLVNRSNVTSFQNEPNDDAYVYRSPFFFPENISLIPCQSMQIESSEAIDYTFHNKFWSLMQYLQDPIKCINNDEDWSKAMGYLQIILQTFSSMERQQSKGIINNH